MRSVTNKNITMANLVGHTNLSGKSEVVLGYQSLEHFFKGGGGGVYKIREV
jgi:hypothetical protein